MDIESAMSELEASIKRRRKWRGRWVFYQVLEQELAPILATADDPSAVRARVRGMLERHGHAPEAPPIPASGRGGDAAPLCRPSPWSK
jgi:hypothetical protein